MEKDRSLRPKEVSSFVTNWFVGEYAPAWQGEFYRQAWELVQGPYKNKGVEIVIVPGGGQNPNSQRLEVRGVDKSVVQKLRDELFLKAEFLSDPGDRF